jgi:HlyD family secretion protein
MVRKLLSGIVVLAVAAAIVYALLPKPALVDFGYVVSGPMDVTVDEEGKTRIKERYIVSAPLQAQLRRIELKPGDPVEAGKTLLAVLEPCDPALLDHRAKAMAEARVKAAEAAKRQSEANILRTKAALEFAKSEYQRATTLRRSSADTDTSFEQAEMMLRTRTEEHRVAEYAEQIAAFELEQARAALLQVDPMYSAGAASARFEIRSPVAGKVLNVFKESAQTVQPGTALLEVGDPTDLEIVVQALSSDAVAIKPGAKVRLEHWGGEVPLNGIVRRVEPSAFTKISALGVEEQRVNVLIDLVDPPEARPNLGDGFRVEARIVVWQRDQVNKVPISALFRHDNSWAVYRVEGGKIKRRNVKIGRTNAVEAELIEGISLGDAVVVHPSDKLSEDMAVQQRGESK